MSHASNVAAECCGGRDPNRDDNGAARQALVRARPHLISATSVQTYRALEAGRPSPVRCDLYVTQLRHVAAAVLARHPLVRATGLPERAAGAGRPENRALASASYSCSLGSELGAEFPPDSRRLSGARFLDTPIGRNYGAPRSALARGPDSLFQGSCPACLILRMDRIGTRAS